MMFYGKKKAITFSFDDGVTQDRRLVKLLDKYHLKGTFNLNSSSFGMPGEINYQGMKASHDKVNVSEVKDLYQNHEIAVHTVHHPDLTKLSDKEIIKEVEDDRTFLENLCGYKIYGMAYPFGTVDERVVKVIKENTHILYSRSVWTTLDFISQKELLNFRPTIHCLDFENLYKCADEFFAYQGDEAYVFYIWGHAYEFDFLDTWDQFEKFLAYIAFKEDVFYGTNKEVLLNEKDLD